MTKLERLNKNLKWINKYNEQNKPFKFYFNGEWYLSTQGGWKRDYLDKLNEIEQKRADKEVESCSSLLLRWEWLGSFINKIVIKQAK